MTTSCLSNRMPYIAKRYSAERLAYFCGKKGYKLIRRSKMKIHSLKRKNVVSLALLFILIFTSLLFVGCNKKTEDR